MSGWLQMKWNMCSKPTTNKPLSPRPATLRVAITGGIGSGKSFVCKRLEAAGYPVFYCDDVAKHIIRTSPIVHDALVALIGADVYDADGRLVKPVLAAYLCASPQQAAKVNAIVHPRVADAFKVWTQQQTVPTVFMECALLFESGFDALVDLTALVVVPQAVRLQRVMARDHVSAEKAQSWMDLQMPEAEKAARADFLLHNDDSGRLDTEIAELLKL